MVESFMARDYDIPLDGVAGVTGSVRVRLKWDPQLLLRARTHSTFMSATRRMTTKMGTTAFNWGEKPASRSNTGPLKSIMEDDKRAIKSDHSPPPPPTGAVEGTIVLSIMEARDLKGKVNPVVHVQLGNLSTYKTKKVKKSTNPEW